MAANPSCRGITNFGKRVVNKISTRDPTHLSTFSPSALTLSLSLRRAAHTSQYDKNPDEQIHSYVIPDEVIQPQSDKYWAPHPQTGVFGPAAEPTSVAGGECISPVDGGKDSVLEQKAWFRPTSLEDLEKPVQY